MKRWFVGMLVLCVTAAPLYASLLIGNNPNVSDGGLNMAPPGAWAKVGGGPDARLETDRGGADGGDWAVGGSDGSGSSPPYDNYYYQNFTLAQLDPAPGNEYYVELSGWAKAWAGWWGGENWDWVQEAHIELWIDGTQVADMMSSNNTNRDTWTFWEHAPDDPYVINTDVEVRLRSVKGNDAFGGGSLGAIFFDSRYDDISLSVTPVPEPATLGLLALGGLALLRRRR